MADTPTLDDWKFAVSEAGHTLRLRVEAAETSENSHNIIQKMNADWPRGQVMAARSLYAARHFAGKKFPHLANLIADHTGLEMASSVTIADHKAKRFERVGEPVFDLCCGIGGDAMSLARTLDVTGVDECPIRAWMCEQNAGCVTIVEDVRAIDVRDAIVHLDPSRRTDAGRRVRSLDDYQPGRDFMDHVARTARGAAIKLGPGVDRGDLNLDVPFELEYISESGTVVQAVLWTGALAQAPGHVTATVIPNGASLTGDPTIQTPLLEDAPLRALIVQADPAIERARLLGALAERHDLFEIHPGLGLLTADTMPPAGVARSFQLINAMPWREKKVKAWLREHDAGYVTVKTRGKAVNPDPLHGLLAGPGGTDYVVFIVRLGQKKVAWITTAATG
ncbi:MAG: class I SAM-dependent methyltransferase [Planctomycetota bacterium]